MAPDVRTIGRQLLVWMVAVAVGIETMAEMVLAAARRDQLVFLVWLSATVALVALAASMETTKRFLDG